MICSAHITLGLLAASISISGLWRSFVVIKQLEIFLLPSQKDTPRHHHVTTAHCQAGAATSSLSTITVHMLCSGCSLTILEAASSPMMLSWYPFPCYPRYTPPPDWQSGLLFSTLVGWLAFNRTPVLWFESAVAPTGSCFKYLLVSWYWHFRMLQTVRR